MGWFSDFKAGAKTKVARFNNSTFKDGVLAASALVVAADGKVDASERAGVVSLVAGNELLQAFGAADLGAQFDAMLTKAENPFARLDLLNLVRKLKSDPAGADTAVKVVLLLANADGDFAESEKKVVREIAGVLGLPAEEYLTA